MRTIPFLLLLELFLPAILAAQAGPPSEPVRFFAAPSAGLAHPERGELLNRDGSPRVARESDYQHFWAQVAPALIRWAEDPRLGLNPAYVAALLAKESGFEPTATSAVPANGYPQMTHIADADMLQIARDAPAWHWAAEEIVQWPRHPLVHRPDAREAATDSLVALGEISGANEYFFDPLTATRASVIWLRMLAEVWLQDEYPGRYGSLARQRLGGNEEISEEQLLELVTVSYNQGYEYVRDLVGRYGADWVGHVNAEAADHLERIKAYTALFQPAPR